MVYGYYEKWRSLTKFIMIVSAVSSVAGFNASYHDSNGDQGLVTSRVKLFDHAPLGKTSRVRITG